MAAASSSPMRSYTSSGAVPSQSSPGGYRVISTRIVDYDEKARLPASPGVTIGSSSAAGSSSPVRKSTVIPTTVPGSSTIPTSPSARYSSAPSEGTFTFRPGSELPYRVLNQEAVAGGTPPTRVAGSTASPRPITGAPVGDAFPNRGRFER